MLGIYNYTVILTYIGFLSGFAGILCAFGGHLTAAVLCLVGAGVCDVFDGKVASTKKDRTRSEKRFGIQIDSLSDLVCFGVLPAVIVYSLGGSRLRILACGAYVLCALTALALMRTALCKYRHSYSGAVNNGFSYNACKTYFTHNIKHSCQIKNYIITSNVVVLSLHFTEMLP